MLRTTPLFLSFFLVSAPVSALVSNALASETPRTIDMTVVLKDLQNKPIPDMTQVTKEDPTCLKCEPLTLGLAVAQALTARRTDEPNLTALDAAKRAALALRVEKNKAAVLTPAQITEIEKLMSIWGAVVSMRVLPLIDPTVDLSVPTK